MSDDQIPEWERELLERQSNRIILIPEENEVPRGLSYVSRNCQEVWYLDREGVPEVPRPERDVLMSLLGYAMDQLSEQDSRERDQRHAEKSARRAAIIRAVEAGE